MTAISAIGTLSGRRAALTARTPRQILVPLLTPILFALVIAPALKEALGGLKTNIDYTAFVSIGTVGLLIPLTTIFAGLSVIVDRSEGAQRELLAAPVPRGFLVIGNLLVALAVSALQVAVLIAVATLRGADFHVTATGMLWFLGAALLFAVFMYGVAETLASRVPKQEEYIGATPAIAILPWFFAGALFPITALPGALTAFAKVLPLTHALALMRYGLLGDHGNGLHDIWGMSSTTAEAALSLAVVALFAALFTAVSIRVFSRSALR
jgi:ABC-2 type transport system permease protein